MGLYGTRRALLKGRRSYSEKVLGYAPIAYWPLWEATGTTAQCLVNSAQNGAYTGVTLANTLAPDGSPAGRWDGANDFANVHTATFNSVFDGQEGTFAIWARAFNAGVWTDGLFRVICNAWVDVNNLVSIQKSSGNNRVDVIFIAGGTSKTSFATPYSPTGWAYYATSWSLSAGATGEMRFYIDGVQQGATQTGLGTWAGNLDANRVNAGCRSNSAPDQVWNGWLAHCAAWDRALTPAQIADLAAV